MLTPTGYPPPPNTAADMAHSTHSTQPALRPHRATPMAEDNPRRRGACADAVIILTSILGLTRGAHANAVTLRISINRHLLILDSSPPVAQGCAAAAAQEVWRELAYTRYSFTYRLLCTNQLLLYCPSHLHRPHGCNTIALLLHNIQPPSDPLLSRHTPYSIVHCDIL